MKKVKILITTLILLVATSVKAEGTVGFKVNCGKDELVIGETLTCDITAEYEGAGFDTVEFNYSSNLNLSLTASGNLTLNDVSKKVTITSPLLIEDEILSSTKLATVKVTTGNDAKAGTETITFSGIKFSEKNNASNVYNLSNLTKTITLVEGVKLSSDATLKSISIDNKVIEGFSTNKKQYDIKVNTKDLFINAVSNSDKAIVTGLGKVHVDEGKALNRVIRVEAEDRKTVNEYTLVITYEKPVDTRSADNSLKQLELYNGTEMLDFVFDNKKTSFDVAVDGIVEKVTIKPTLNDEKAKFVAKYGARDVKLNYGKNKVEIRVQAENEQIKTYTLNITREDNRSTDGTLSKLLVNEVSVPLEKDKYEYDVNLKYNVEETKIEATPANEKSKVEYKDIKLVDGVNPPVVIKVTAENGDKKEYKLNIKRLTEEESKIELEKIEIVGYAFPFDKNTKTYNLDVKKEDESLNIVVVPDTVQKEILGNKELVNNSTVIVRVTDDNGTETYTINVHKEEESSLAWLCYTVFGLGVATLLLSIIYAISRKKK